MGKSHHTLACIGAGGFHRLAYSEWGAPASPRVLMCVHGLTRNGRDFDYLAAALEDSFRIACPDVAGRGRSEWLAEPKDYNNLKYAADMTVLIGRLNASSVDWLGTSMGGLIGLIMAAMPQTPIRRLILNDVGPWIPKESLVRIGEYVGKDPRFDNLAAAEAYHREVHAPFGKLTDAQWAHLTTHNVQRGDDGRYRLAYDPAIAAAFEQGPVDDVDLWQLWDAVRCPVLVLRGAESDLLPREVAEEMSRRGPKAELIEFPDCGHAPALMAAEQIDVVRRWLLA